MTTTTGSSPFAPPAARSRGRPRKVDDARRRKICVLVSIGCDLRQAAYYAGCSYPTIRRETLRHPEFRHRLRQAMKMKAEINTLRGSNSKLDQNISELQQKLCIAPADSIDDRLTATARPP
jgi:hypothetical protein